MAEKQRLLDAVSGERGRGYHRCHGADNKALDKAPEVKRVRNYWQRRWKFSRKNLKEWASRAQKLQSSCVRRLLEQKMRKKKMSQASSWDDDNVAILDGLFLTRVQKTQVSRDRRPSSQPLSWRLTGWGALEALLCPQPSWAYSLWDENYLWDTQALPHRVDLYSCRKEKAPNLLLASFSHVNSNDIEADMHEGSTYLVKNRKP